MIIIDPTVTWSWLMNGRQYLTFNWVAWLIIHTDIRLRNYFVTRIYQISCNILRYFKQVKLVSKHQLNETAIPTFCQTNLHCSIYSPWYFYMQLGDIYKSSAHSRKCACDSTPYLTLINQINCGLIQSRRQHQIGDVPSGRVSVHVAC